MKAEKTRVFKIYPEDSVNASMAPLGGRACILFGEIIPLPRLGHVCRWVDPILSFEGGHQVQPGLATCAIPLATGIGQ